MIAPAEAVARRFDVSRESFDRLQRYVALLERWQAVTNLIGRSTEGEIWTRHIADALQLVPLLPPSCRTVVDLGSGAGIPGLLLSLVAPVRVTLVESNGKKAAFLREAIRTTGANAAVNARRIETMTVETLPDVVTARALAPLPRLLDLAAPFLRAGALGLFHKGRDVDAELTEARKSWRFTATKHPSAIDSHGVVLAVQELSRAAT